MITSMAEKRFSVGGVADEASLFVLDALQRDNWQKVSLFQGKSSFATFLRSVVYRLLEDFSRKKYGRRQPPQWLKRLGGIWLRLYIFLCLERLPLDEAVQRGSQMAAAPPAEIEQAAYEIKERIRGCGEHQGLEIEFEDCDTEKTADIKTPEVRLDLRQRRQLMAVICGGITKAESSAAGTFEKMFDFPFDLTSQEKLLLKMRYVEGLSVARMATFLDCSRHQINGKLRRTLQKVRKVIADSGLEEEVINQVRGE